MKRILIIEDNREIRENTAELLEIKNYKVITAENGNEGFQLAKEFQPDVILCDLMMPETDGQMFLTLAKAEDLTRNIPVIFFSAGSSAPVINGFTKEIKAWIKKPFTEEELLLTINKSLEFV